MNGNGGTPNVGGIDPEILKKLFHLFLGEERKVMELSGSGEFVEVAVKDVEEEGKGVLRRQSFWVFL